MQKFYEFFKNKKSKEETLYDIFDHISLMCGILTHTANYNNYPSSMKQLNDLIDLYERNIKDREDNEKIKNILVISLRNAYDNLKNYRDTLGNDILKFIDYINE